MSGMERIYLIDQTLGVRHSVIRNVLQERLGFKSLLKLDGRIAACGKDTTAQFHAASGPILGLKFLHLLAC